MKKNKLIKLISLTMLSMTIAASVIGCGKEEPSAEDAVVDEVVQEVPEKEEIEEVIEEAKPKEISANQNLLTGLPTLTDEAIGKRPVAVMINNVPKALPQYGIDNADVIFEVIVEGNQTRFMALYGDYTQVPKICSVRSCRKYFPILSEGFDAIYVNWGMSKYYTSCTDCCDGRFTLLN